MVWIIVVGFLVLSVIAVLKEEEGVPSICLFMAIAISGVYLITFAVSVSNNADLRAFAAQNKQAYVEVAELTRVMVAGDPAAASSTVVDGKSWEQVKIAADRLKELRDSIVDYNSTLRSKREYASHWFLRMWIAEPPAELEYIDFPVSK